MSMFNSWWNRKARRSAKSVSKDRPRAKQTRRLSIEWLEGRQMLSSISLVPTTTQQTNPYFQAGPSTVLGGVSAVNGGIVAGAVNQVAVNPGNSSQMFAASVNGGVWLSNTGGASWLPVTDTMPSLSIGSVAFDAGDPTHNTLVAGVGRFSTAGEAGGALVGIYRSTNDGATWTLPAGSATLVGLNITSVYENGNVIVVAGDSGGTKTGLYISTDSGATFKVFGNGVAAGPVDAMVADPGSLGRLYVAVLGTGGGSANIYRIDAVGQVGQVVTNIGNGIGQLGNTQSPAAAIRFAVQPNVNSATNIVYVGIVESGLTPGLQGLYRSSALGVGWSSFGTMPFSTENGAQIGVEAAVSVTLGGPPYYFSMAADFSSSISSLANYTVYLGGNHQPLPYANSITATAETGRIFSATFSTGIIGSSPSYKQLTNNQAGGTGPAENSRSLLFNPNTGNLIETDDGGIYQRTSPDSAPTGTWTSLNGGTATGAGQPGALLDNEVISVSYDSLFNGILEGGPGGGTAFAANVTGSGVASAFTMITPPNTTFQYGGYTGVDDYSLAAGSLGNPSGPSASIRYVTGPFLTGFERLTYQQGSATPSSTVALPLLINGAGGINLVTLENNTNGTLNGSNVGRIQFYQPYAINNAPYLNSTSYQNQIAIITNIQYESFDQGNTFNVLEGVTQNAGTGQYTATTTMPGLATVIAYGGGLFNGAALTANPNVLYFGIQLSAGKVGSTFYERQSGTGVAQQSLGYQASGGTTPTGIAMSPFNYAQVFVTDTNGQVWVAADGGAGTTADFTNITGNLNGLAGTFISSIAYIPHTNPLTSTTGSDGLDSIVVGTNDGIYRMFVNAPGIWSKLAGPFPNANVTSLTYNSAQDVLVIGTLGRGVFDLPNFRSSLNSYTLQIAGDLTGGDNILLQVNTKFASLMDVNISGGSANSASVPLPYIAATNVVATGTGNALQLNYANGNPINVGTFNYNGGTNGSIIANANADYNLADSYLIDTLSSTPVNMTNVNQAFLTAGAGYGHNVFTLSGWSGTGQITGGTAGGNMVTFNNNVSNFALTNTQFYTSLGTYMGMSNIQAADLIGGVTPAAFYIENWAGQGFYQGKSGADLFDFIDGNLSDNSNVQSFWGVGNNDTAYISDTKSTANTNYNITGTTIRPDVTTPRPAAGGFNYDGSTRTLEVDGGQGVNRFYAVPASATNYYFNGNQTAAPTGAALDNLSISFFGTTNRTLHQTSATTGYYTFTNPTSRITWQGMATVNGSEPIVVAPGGSGYSATSEPLIQVYDSDSGELDFQFMAYASNFHGGVQVTLAAINGNPVIVTAPGSGVAGNVELWDARKPTAIANGTLPLGSLVTLTPLATLAPFGAGWTGGINVAAGPVLGGTNSDLIVSEASGAGLVAVYQTSQAVVGGPIGLAGVRLWQPYPTSFNAGAVVSVGDENGDGHAEVITAPGPGAAAQVDIWDGLSVLTQTSPTLIGSFLAEPSSFHGGVALAVGNTGTGAGTQDIIVGAGSAGGVSLGSQISVFQGGANILVNQPNTLPVPFYQFKTFTGASSTLAPLRIVTRDILGDGTIEILAAQGPNGTANAVNAYRPQNGQLIGSITVQKSGNIYNGGLNLG
jgi:hypothetical protein